MSALLVFALMLQAGGDAAMQAYRDKTRAIIPCKTTDDPDEVTICALREADKKYRVPSSARVRRTMCPTRPSGCWRT